MGSYGPETGAPLFGTGKLEDTIKPFKHPEAFIPAATAQTHASNLLVLANGDLLCAWFGGSQEGKPDISIYTSRFSSAYQTWSEAKRVTFDSTRSEQNPDFFRAPSGELWLMYTSQRAGDQDSAVVKRQISLDDGESWTEPKVLFGEPGTFIRQPMVVLDDGRWVMPIFKCRTEPGTRWVGNDDISCVSISCDEDKTWSETEVPNSYGCVHMEIQCLKNRSYLALFRSRWADKIYLARSEDAINWSEPLPTNLPNPNAGICFDVLPSGRVLAVYNHSSKANALARRTGLYDEIAEKGDNRQNQTSRHGDKEAFWGAPRAPLCLAWSDDEGRSWKHRILEEGDGFCLTNNSEEKLNRELSYPSMALSGDGKVHVAFTFWQQRIKYVQLELDAVESW